MRWLGAARCEGATDPKDSARGSSSEGAMEAVDATWGTWGETPKGRDSGAGVSAAAERE